MTLVRRLRAWIAPFTFVEQATPSPDARGVFERSFGAPPPAHPHHFVALRGASGDVLGYVHYTAYEPGVYLCGGLCVDQRAYRRLTPRERRAIRKRGSLSRWLLNESIARLRDRIAVFAYTGNAMSERDGLASGFVATPHPHLIVQWNRPPDPSLLHRIHALGPF